MTITCDKFLKAVKLLITVPANQVLLEDEDILDLATNRMRDSVIPLMDSVNEEFFVTKTSKPILKDKPTYPIPPRAIGRKIRELKLVNPSGVISDFPKVGIERSQLYRTASIPFGFHFTGDRIQIVPTPSEDGYGLEIWYPCSPGDLIPTSKASRVVSITDNGTTIDVTVDAVPESFIVDKDIDFINGVSGNWYLSTDSQIIGITGNTLTFNALSVPDELRAGDYVSLAGTSPILQIPEVGMPYLVTLTASDMLQALSDFDGKANLESRAKEQKENFLKVISPRIDGEPTIIINDRSLLRGRVRRNYAGLYRG